MAARKKVSKRANAKPAARKRRATVSVDRISVPDTGPPNRVRFDPYHGASARSVASSGSAAGQTSVYVHGIGNHPEEQVLVVRWDRALFGKDMGDRTRMAYWVNRARYPQASSCDCIDPSCPCHDPEESLRAKRVLATGEPMPELELEEAVNAITSDPAQRAFLRDVGARMIDEARNEARKQQAEQSLASSRLGARKGTYGVGSKGVGDALLRKITDLITGVALPDVQDFLFEPDHRAQMEETFLARLRSGGGPFVVVAHSQGSMIAYDVLRQLKRNDVDVRLFVTIGSPLGLPPVRAVFKKWTGDKRLPYPSCVSRWINVAAEGDVVALDPKLRDDIDLSSTGTFQDYFIDRTTRDANLLFAGNAHSSMGYLSSADVQREVYTAVGREFASSLARQIITSDLVEKMEQSPDDQRHAVMIEVTEIKEKGELSIEMGRRRIDERLREMGKRQGSDVARMKILHHARYVSAMLNRPEIELLRTESDGLQVNRVWQNARKRALICRSAHALHASPAHQAYAAHGENIEWAVLDTGVEHTHPHFDMHKNLGSLWDCTRSDHASSASIAEPSGGFVDYTSGKAVWPEGAEDFRDRSGHGTHVAGIIAGIHPYELMDDGQKLAFAGMAPKAKLHSFKVLNDRGQGQDAWILIALDKIARINENAQELRIQGINLSLGGNFDPSVYGCGHTPLCRELRRLWRQGVLIVLAAGNEGFTVLQTLQDGPWQANLDLSIGDPANLEEAIAVGSVHRVNPHTFGVSYFSSRGPTADGRRKPDLVAPGEKILSARADYARMIPPDAGEAPFAQKELEGFSAEQLYVAESGTSMAAPHVSGLLAAFLSQRREFIGYPDRVKRILLDNCTDLGRDSYAQGAGLPNLMRMLGGT